MTEVPNDDIEEIIEGIGELFDGKPLPIVMTALVRVIGAILTTQVPTEEMSIEVFSAMIKSIGDIVAAMIQNEETAWTPSKEKTLH